MINKEILENHERISKKKHSNMSKMNNVLVFTSTFPRFTPGDATPPFVYELSRRLAHEGMSITVLTPRVPGSKVYEEIDGLKIHRYQYFFCESLEKLNDGAILPNLRANKWLYLQIPFLLISGLYHLIRLMRRERIDTIHAHWIIPQGFLAVLYKRFFNKNIKILCTTHGGDIFGLRGYLGTMVKKYTLKYIDQLTVVSNAIKDECLKLGVKEDQVSVIPMGVDTTLFHPDKYDEAIKREYNIQGKLILFVGRLAEKKGVRYLIDAMPGIVAQYPDTKLLIVGHGPLEQELRNQARELNLTDNIIFAGAIPNSELPRYYATADIFVGPSIIAKDGDREGLPVTYIESLLSGCYLLGTDLEGNKDIIVDGENGYFIKQNNANDIKEMVLFLFKKNKINKIELRNIIKRKFGWDTIVKKYSKLFKNDK